MDLLNGLIACLPTAHDRNALRQELKDSGFEKCMGGSLRTCKEKWYGYVHAGLSTWVGAAKADGWAFGDVKEGPRRDEPVVMSPRKGNGKRGDEAPRLEMPKLGFRAEEGGRDDKWL